MTTIKITKKVREDLRVFENDDETVEDAVNRLLDIAEPYLSEDMVFGDGSTNINLSSDTMNRIKSFQVRKNESYGRVLQRALTIVDEKNL